ncbi:MAG TPA: hypothetical protein EYP85_01550 [Armatimonadetes bacterium]|nr:hypothetical protein [Armatimonadota bacterium]
MGQWVNRSMGRRWKAWVAGLSVGLWLLSEQPAQAFNPGNFAPLQALLSFLPQILAFVGAVVALALKRDTWRHLWYQAKAEVRKRRQVLVPAALLGAVALIWGGHWLLTRTGEPVAASVTGPADDWPLFRGNVARTGTAGPPKPALQGKEIWAFREPLDRAPFASSPAVVGGYVYVGADNDTLYCFEARTGRVRWKFTADWEVFCSPAVVHGRVYFGEGLHYVTASTFRCLDAATGKVLWEFPVKSHTESSPAVAEGKVYFGAGDEGLFCVTAAEGKKVWQFKGEHIDTAPLAVNGRVYFGSGYGNSHLYCLDGQTGKVIWKVPVEHAAWGAPALEGQRIYFGLGNGNFERSDPHPYGEVRCLDARTGKELWRRAVGDAVIGAIAVSKGRCYFGSRDGRVYCVRADNGKILWRFRTGGPVVSSPAVAGGYVYLGSRDGKLYCLQARTGQLVWAFNAARKSLGMDAGLVASPAVAEGRVYVGSLNFFFFCLGKGQSVG